MVTLTRRRDNPLEKDLVSRGLTPVETERVKWRENIVTKLTLLTALVERYFAISGDASKAG